MSAPSGRGGGLRPLRTALEGWTPARGRDIDPLHAIAAAWPGIVGADVAGNSLPLELAGPVLVVGTRSSAWSQQLQFLSLPILAKLRALPSGEAVERLTFRTGLMPRARRRTSGAVAVRSPRAPVRLERVVPPAVDVFEAFERLRAHMQTAVQATAVRCQTCGAGREGSPASLSCAPCAGEAVRARRTLVERLIYLAPWLSATDLREQIPDLRVTEFEQARKALLARWWLVLERARVAGRVSPSRLERHVGSSYVLLQSRLAPDRITPAVVRNLLGTELETLLWPHGASANDEAR